MSLLDTAIAELLSIEPFWNICYPCKFQGFCCIGAEITFDGNEKNIVDQYVSTLPANEQEIIRDNAARNQHCIYRAPEKCLIHDVRPENCRYTPFQATIDPENILRYSMVRIGKSGHCEFRSREIQLSEPLTSHYRHEKFLLLPNFDRNTRYLSLNWIVQQGNHP